jgi:hypothetical protein
MMVTATAAATAARHARARSTRAAAIMQVR